MKESLSMYTIHWFSSVALLPMIASIEIYSYQSHAESYIVKVGYEIVKSANSRNNQFRFRADLDLIMKTSPKGTDSISKPPPPPSSESPTIFIKKEGDYENWCRINEDTDDTPYNQFVQVISSALGCGSNGIHIQTICSDTGTCTDSNTTCSAPSQLVDGPLNISVVSPFQRFVSPSRQSQRVGSDGGNAMWAVFTVPRATYDAFLAWSTGDGAAPLRDVLGVIAIEVTPQNTGRFYPHADPFATVVTHPRGPGAVLIFRCTPLQFQSPLLDWPEPPRISIPNLQISIPSPPPPFPPSPHPRTRAHTPAASASAAATPASAPRPGRQIFLCTPIPLALSLLPSPSRPP